eukprot:gene4367-4620_t
MVTEQEDTAQQQQATREQEAAAGVKPFLVTVTISNGGGEVIRDALNSVVDWADLCLVLDTGIKDKTLEIAKEVVGDKLQVTRINWPADFSKARNAALEAASRTGASWAVVLDTDERIQYDKDKLDWREYLRASTADVVSILHDSLTYKKPRIFRLPSCGLYVGPTHEYFEAKPTAVQHDMDNIATFGEVPKDADGVKAKAKRDIELLSYELANKPTEQRWWYYLGDAYEIAGDCSNAIKAWNSCAKLVQGWDEEGACEDWDGALEALARGMTRHPGLPELPWYAGWISYQAQRYQQAEAWSHMAIALGCHQGLCVPRIGFNHPPGKYEGPYDVLHWALKQSGKEEEAKAALENMEAAMAARLSESSAADG